MILGLKINYEKCEMIGLRTTDTFLVSMADASNCKVGKFRTKYLGLPLCMGITKQKLQDSIVERLKRN